MQELWMRLQLIFTQLADQVRAAVAAQTEHVVLTVLDTVLPVACGVLRVLAVLVALIILVRCVLSLVRERTGKEIWG